MSEALTLVGGALLGLASALIVSKAKSWRERRNAASLVRLKLEAWVEEVERTIHVYEDLVEDKPDQDLLLLIGGSWQWYDRPQVGSLFESRLAELMGYEKGLDEELTEFHEAASKADRQFSQLKERHGPAAALKQGAQTGVRHAASSTIMATRHALKATGYLEDLFAAGWASRWNRAKRLFGRYSGPLSVQLAERELRLMEITLSSEEHDEEADSDGEAGSRSG